MKHQWWVYCGVRSLAAYLYVRACVPNQPNRGHKRKQFSWFEGLLQSPLADQLALRLFLVPYAMAAFSAYHGTAGFYLERYFCKTSRLQTNSNNNQNAFRHRLGVCDDSLCHLLDGFVSSVLVGTSNVYILGVKPGNILPRGFL